MRFASGLFHFQQTRITRLNDRDRTPHVLVRLAGPEDAAAIDALNRLAFEEPIEAELVQQLRLDGDATLELVVEHNGLLIGHILFSPVVIQSTQGRFAGLSLGPMAVHPEWQQQGIGSHLLQAGVEGCRQQGHAFVVVLGHPQFYVRAGFSARLAEPLECPFGAGAPWMALELIPCSLLEVAGPVQYAKAFNRFLEPPTDSPNTL